MSAVQRNAWKREYDRLWFAGKLRRLNDPKVIDLNRKHLYHFGMDDAAIDFAITAHPVKRAKRKKEESSMDSKSE
jgi:hypothetical protein